MAKAIPNPEVPSNGNARKHLLPESLGAHGRENGSSPGGVPHLANLEFWANGNPLTPGRADSVAEGQELLKTLGLEAGTAAPRAAPELDQLRGENAELRGIIAELKEELDSRQKADDAGLLERQKEYESLLEEKSELIRSLHLKIQELQEQKPAVPLTPKEEELIALSEELERERCQLQKQRRQLEEERQQLAEDEQIMTQQLREMEVQMARERADFARQRSELNRISEEIRREMENCERNGLLNERLNQLRNRFHEVSNPSKGPPPSRESAPAPAGHGGANGNGTPEGAGKRRETFLGRFFG